jgi:hypothetical protein
MRKYAQLQSELFDPRKKNGSEPIDRMQKKEKTPH